MPRLPIVMIFIKIAKRYSVQL